MKKDRARLCILLLLAIIFDSIPVFAQTSEPFGFIGIVTKSDSKIGSQYTFANIDTHNPSVTYPSGNRSETVKIYEDDELIVLTYLALLTGSTETYYLNKKRNRFTIIEVGALEATVRGIDFIPQITYGTLFAIVIKHPQKSR